MAAHGLTVFLPFCLLDFLGCRFVRQQRLSYCFTDFLMSNLGAFQHVIAAPSQAISHNGFDFGIVQFALQAPNIRLSFMDLP